LDFLAVKLRRRSKRQKLQATFHVKHRCHSQLPL
jgi:hypothetical protein